MDRQRYLVSEHLDSALGMKNGEVANGAKIDKGLSAAARRYGHNGHLEARVNGAPEFDDALNRISYKITVKEGPQFKMGKLTIKDSRKQMQTPIRKMETSKRRGV